MELCSEICNGCCVSLEYGMSSINIAVQFNVNHTVIGRFIQLYHQTGTVNDRPRSGRPRLTSPRENRPLTRRAKRSPFTSATKLRKHWPPGDRVSVRTVIRRLHNVHLRARLGLHLLEMIEVRYI